MFHRACDYTFCTFFQVMHFCGDGLIRCLKVVTFLTPPPFPPGPTPRNTKKKCICYLRCFISFCLKSKVIKKYLVVWKSVMLVFLNIVVQFMASGVNNCEWLILGK